MGTNSKQISSNGGDPAEQALMEEFSCYLAALSKSATEPMIAAMRQQERELRECIQTLIAAMRQQERETRECIQRMERQSAKQSSILANSVTDFLTSAMHQQEARLAVCSQRLEKHSGKQSTMISRWMTLVVLVLLAEIIWLFSR
jgi:hypothetical protein